MVKQKSSASTAGNKLIKLITPSRYHGISSNGAAVERVKGFRIVSLLAQQEVGMSWRCVYLLFCVDGRDKEEEHERIFKEEGVAAPQVSTSMYKYRYISSFPEEGRRRKIHRPQKMTKNMLRPILPYTLKKAGMGGRRNERLGVMHWLFLQALPSASSPKGSTKLWQKCR